jgi:hypothetical protein
MTVRNYRAKNEIFKSSLHGIAELMRASKDQAVYLGIE